MTNHETLKIAALGYEKIGMATLPLKSDKRPSLETWGEYQKTKPDESTIRRWFDGSNYKTSSLGLITGEVSDFLEGLDIDCKNDLTGSLMDDFCSLGKEHLPELFPKLVIASTVNKGFHVLVKVPPETIEGNKKLASRPATDEEAASGDKVKVLIETRGEGGYIVAVPSNGYKWTQGNAESIPLITAEERETLWTIARSFDQMPVKPTPEEQKQLTNEYKQQSGDVSPFNDYNQRADVSGLLAKHGWKFIYQRGVTMHYKRPGITDSKTSASYHAGMKIFYPFSTSTVFEAGRGYNPTQVYTILEHGGDYSAASKQLYQDGYGTRRTQKTTETKNVAQTQMQEWQAPKPLDLTLKPVETIEDDCLPKTLVNWLRPASKVIGCPFDFLVLSAVIMVGSLIGSRLRVKSLQNSDWFVVPNLYGGCVGLPSTKKTPALDETRKPILELQAKARKEFSDKRKDFVIEAKYYERETTAIYKEKLDLAGTKAKINKLTEPATPILRRYETNDITTPKLAQFLAENPNGLLQNRDELTGWFKSLEADYDLNARSFILELWKGAIAYELARVGNGEIQITSGTLSIIGGIQPSKLQRYIGEAYSFDNADGLPQRFLFAYPDTNKRGEKPTPADYAQMQNGYAAVNRICKTIADYDFKGNVVGANGDKFQIVKFNRDAQSAVDEWNADIEAEAESLQIEDEPFSSYLY